MWNLKKNGTDEFFYKKEIKKKNLIQWASLVAQTIKNLPAMQETLVQSLAWEDPLEKEMATCSSILAWKIPWREEPSRLLSMRSQSVRHH